MKRLRQAARRWPGLCLGLLLLAFTSQSLATTSDWCLHGGEGAHVASSLAPCDEAHAGDAKPPMHHVAAASDGASAPASAVAALPLAAHWQFLPWVLALEFSGQPDAAQLRRGSWPDAGRPTLSDAVPGESFRLLI